MPGIRRVLDPEASAAAPSAAKKTPPRAPHLVQEQDGDPGEETAENRAVPSPCTACRTSPSKKTPPGACLLDGDTGEKTTEAHRAVPSACDASPPPRALGQPAPTTSTLHQVTDGAPAPPPTHAPVAPRTDRRKPTPMIAAGEVEKKAKKPAIYPRAAPPSLSCPPQARYATAPASYAPVPFDWPIPYRGIFPRPYAPAPPAVFPGAMPSQQLPRTAAAVAVARTQPQGSAGFKRKGEVPVDSAKVKEHPLRISDEPVQYSMEQEILDSDTGFASQNSLDTNIIRFALASIPRGPEILLQCERCSGGDDAARCGTCIHSYSRDAISHVGGSSDSAVKAFCFEVGPELMRFGTDPWKKIWEEQPLILRDIDIVKAANDSGVQVNVAQRITEILQHHPGPVAYFRVDTCQIRSNQVVDEWFELLRSKHVKEVVFLNRCWPSFILEFSVTNINCQSLEKLSLSFMKLNDIFLENADNLKEINLSSCSITALDLYALSCECKHLQVLSIGMYEGNVIRINSKSLEALKIWHCTVRKIAVQNALKLRRVLVASGPNRPSIKVGIWIEDALVLSAASFDLSSQLVSICDLRCKTDNAPLDSIRKLVLHISFKAEKEKAALLKLMESSNTLKELILWRNDEKYRYESWDAWLDDWSYQFKELSCLKSHLEVFMIQDCKCGEAELAVSSAVLEHSSCLKQLILEGSIFQDETLLNLAKNKLEKVTRSSKSAILTLKSGLFDCDKKMTPFLEEV